MQRFLTATEAACLLSDQLGRPVLARAVSDALYQGRVNTDDVPIIGGRRAIPASLLPELARALIAPQSPAADPAETPAT